MAEFYSMHPALCAVLTFASQLCGEAARSTTRKQSIVVLNRTNPKTNFNLLKEDTPKKKKSIYKIKCTLYLYNVIITFLVHWDSAEQTQLSLCGGIQTL